MVHLPDTPELRSEIKSRLRRYDQDTVSNPVPGIYNAMRFLFDKENVKMHMGIYVFGDEFNSSDAADAVIRRLDELNPADENGVRRVTINAVGAPVRSPGAGSPRGRRIRARRPPGRSVRRRASPGRRPARAPMTTAVVRGPSFGHERRTAW